jgi:poly(A) polymerase
MSESLTPLAPADAGRFGWIAARPVKRVVDALEAAEAGAARFVGGCVRDSLLGDSPKDVDIATPLAPDAVIAALSRAGLGVAPTGLEHGTVTAIADHQGIEVTSLRADVSTDGRRATVAFTRDWAVDAARRDFTVNALYLTPSLLLFDPVGGLADLRARRVRFIGRPEDRIREDFLRILRFFRFSARFAAGFDEPGLRACAGLKAGIRRLSAERVGDEFMKLLALPSPQESIAAMQTAGVLAEVWPAPPAIGVLAQLKAIDPLAPPPLGLAALFAEAGEGVDARLRLSNAQSERRRAAVANAREISDTLDERAARVLLYRLGAERWRDACLIAEARALADAPAPARAAAFERLRELPLRWPPPRLPFAGRDALAAGIPEGPLVASVLRAAEARWLNEDFPPDERAWAIFREETTRLISKG